MKRKKLLKVVLANIYPLIVFFVITNNTMRNKIYINKWEKYNKWEVIKEVEKRNRSRIVKCKCICWLIKELYLSDLRWWKTKSCWCGWYRSIANTTHWMTKTKIYMVWWWILKRCNKIKYKDYKYYGWRGIKCEWDNFEEFYKDMWNTYKEWLTLDRINNDWNYSKNNCKWSTWKEQANNKSNTILYKGKCLLEWSKILWWDNSVVYKRLKAWWNIEDSISIPIIGRR